MAQSHISSGGLYAESDIAESLFDDDRVYEARNEAMRSLERATVSPSMSETKRDAKGIGMTNPVDLLQACRNCNFVRPYIVEIMDGNYDPEEDSID